MEELSQNLEGIIKRAEACEADWENMFQAVKKNLHSILHGSQAPVSQSNAFLVAASPQQKKKRPKRLSAVVDHDEESECIESSSVVNETIPTESQPLPEPAPEPEPQIQQPPEPEHVFARPARAAKLKVENCLKEPSLHTKLRRDAPVDTRKVKKESEQRPSQAATLKSNKSVLEASSSVANDSVASSKKADESVVVLAEKATSVVQLFSDEEDSSSSVVAKKKLKTDTASFKNPVVKVKKEKLSLEDVQKTSAPTVAAEPPAEVPLKHETTSSVEETMQSTGSDTNTTARTKRGRKKKLINHRPIKEERLSNELAVPSPVSNRTRSGSISKPRPASVYEDAVDNIQQDPIVEENVASNTPKTVAPVAQPSPANETVAANNVTTTTACDATFVTTQGNNTFAVPAPQTTFIMENNPNATVTVAPQKGNSVGDATFDVRGAPQNDSIMTEDDSFDKPLITLQKLPPPPPPLAKGKVLKAKSKPQELFNPCVQSPVKKKVEAFEHHAQAASQESRLKTRSKKTKENTEPELPSIRDLKSGTVTTPVIGKPHAPVLGRFLTPTQQSNVTPTAGQAKKLPNSASKIMTFPTSKHSTASSLKSSSSSQTLSRENSEDDIKKGFNKLQQLAEERKKKRELKHQQAAQLREAKEKERAERLLKLMKEREEKNRKKELEMEQKKRELEEIHRNLKLQEDREAKQLASAKTKVNAADAARQERELLEQMKAPKIKMPPPPKLHNKYNFNMLHSDDSTDEEGKTSHKRPTPPLWSKSSLRAEYIASQSYLSSEVVDSFFSVQPMTPDLKAIFPNIDPRYLKRNSSAIWQTPPRYSEMPKY